MSKKENHRYILGATLRTLIASIRPRGSLAGLWVVLVVLGGIDGAWEVSGTRARSPALFLAVAALLTVLFFALGRWRQSRVRAGYWEALQQADPEQLIGVIVRSLKSARAVPDIDAFGAQSKALAYALYGRGADATSALAEIGWAARAPLVQGAGLSAEGLIELLCRRDIRRALELNRKARALAAVSGAIPGAAQSERFHETCVAVGEALLNAASPSCMKWLEEAAADRRHPPLQLLGSFGLAVALDRSGNTERASQLRAYLLEVAPHCGPLHLKPADFQTSGRAAAASAGAMTSSILSSGAGSGAALRERQANGKPFGKTVLIVVLWLVLIVMFVTIRVLFTPAE